MQVSELKMRVAIIAATAAVLLFSGKSIAQAEDDKPWWPNSQWGAGDQAGASNWITPAKILQALKGVKTGEVYELGHVYERGMPLFGDRDFKMTIPAQRPKAAGDNASVWLGDFFVGQIGQVGTQFDALSHVGKRITLNDGSVQDVYYNGFTKEQVVRGNGVAALGVEQAGPIITQGILLDIAGYKNVSTLSSRHEVTMKDVAGALSRQGLNESDIRPGDAVLLNYGWAVNWNNPPKYNNADYNHPENKGSPGIGLEVARWLAEKQVALVGADSCCVEVIPNPDASLYHPVHQELIMLHGIYMLENLDLRSLAADDVYRFLFIFNPLRLKGATGSPGRPIAIR